FQHMYEEPDYALQCYAQGFGVWFEPTLRVRHHLTSQRRRPLLHHQTNARNELWSVLLRCPFVWLPFVITYRVCRQFVFAITQGMSWVIREPLWWIEALGGWRRVIETRKAVS